MDRPRRRLGAELLPVTLIFAGLAGTFGAVVSLHRHPPAAAPTPRPAVAVAGAMVSEPAPAPVATPPDPPPAPPPEPAPDPTAPIVAELAEAEAKERDESVRANRRAGALEVAAKAANREADRWKRSLTLARSHVDALAAQATRREVEADRVAIRRDALARRRDALKTAIEADRGRPAGYAVLPHRGPNGTWQRPIVIECKDGGASIRPNGPGFTLLDISSPYGVRSNPFVAAVAREVIRVQRRTSPDGEPATPYIFFIVRPDGIAPYYEARARLERLGIAFGYELADADWTIDVPDLDRDAAWDGSPPPVAGSADFLATADDPLGGASARSGSAAANPFLWPKHPPGLEPSGGIDSRATGGVERFRDGDGPRFLGGLGDAATGTAERFAQRDSATTDDLPGGRAGGGLDRSAGLAPIPGGRLGARGTGEWDATWDRALKGSGPDRPVGLGHAAGASPDEARSAGPSEGPVRRGFDHPERLIAGGTRPSGEPLARGEATGGHPEGGTAPGPRGETPSRNVASGGGGDARREAGASAAGSTGQGSASGSAGGQGGTAGGGSPGTPAVGGSTAPMELVLACGPKGVAVHPGDYRVTSEALKSGDALLIAQLRALVRHRENARPGTTVVPSIRYLIEPGGRETYARARAQVAVSGLDWPATIQVSGGDILRLYSTDSW